MASKITKIDLGSPAYKAGIQVGETLLSIDNSPIQDVLDYKFYGYDSHVDLCVENCLGQTRTLTIHKREGEDLGLEFETYLMDQAKSCSNRCVFCFIDQLPRNMRDTLYFKDDDARLSFLMGNYISLTNLSDEDVQRMIKMRISPVNVSVQATDPAVRIQLLRNKNAGKALEAMRKFADGHIEMNCQLVICAGINDGDILRRSLDDLAEFYPSVNSISVVPAGLTAHREGLYPLSPITPDIARDIISIVETFGEKCLEKFGTRLAFCGDELYIKAQMPLPDTEFYEDFTQFENGVGMMALFMEEFRAALPDYENTEVRPFSIATGTAAAPFLAKLLDEAASKCDNLHGNIYPITNEFFGGGVSVAGLITGRDLVRQLSDKPLGERVFISANMLRNGGDVFLDDMTPKEVSRAIGAPIETVEIDGADLLRKIFERN